MELNGVFSINVFPTSLRSNGMAGPTPDPITPERTIAYNILTFLNTIRWSKDTRVMLDLVPLLMCTFCNNGNGYNQHNRDKMAYHMHVIREQVYGMNSMARGDSRLIYPKNSSVIGLAVEAAATSWRVCHGRR